MSSYIYTTLSDDKTSASNLFVKNAKPRLTNISPYTVVLPFSSWNESQDFYVTVYGKDFFSLTNVYVSASNIDMIDDITLFSPFSSDPSLFPYNPAFNAAPITEFVQNNNSISFVLPLLDDIGYLDVIVQNQAGYSVLSRDSFKQSISSYPGFVNLQLPCISGIQVLSQGIIILNILLTEDGQILTTEDGLEFAI